MNESDIDSNCIDLYNLLINEQKFNELETGPFVTPSESYLQFLYLIKNTIPKEKLNEFLKNNNNLTLEEYFTPKMMFDMAFEQFQNDFVKKN